MFISNINKIKKSFIIQSYLNAGIIYKATCTLIHECNTTVIQGLSPQTNQEIPV